MRVLFVGQVVRNNASGDNPAGTFVPAAGGSLLLDIPNDGSTDALFGRRSMLAAMLRSARKENPITRFDAIVLDDPAGDFNHEALIALSGAATEDGELVLSLGSRSQHIITIPVSKNESAATIGSNSTAFILADLTAPLFTDATGSNIPLFAANRGLEALKLSYEVVALPPGITATVSIFTKTGAAPAANPILTDILDLVAEERYQTIVWPESYDQDLVILGDNYKPLRTHLETKFNFPNKILDGVGIITNTETATILEGIGQGLDTQVLSIFGNAFVDNAKFPLVRGSALA